MENIKDAIFNRYSTRKYDGRAVSDEDILKIEKKVHELNCASGLAFKFVKNGENGFNGFLKSYGAFSGVKSVILLCGDKYVENRKERVGYYGEELVLYLTSIGYDTCWVGGTFSKSSFAEITQANEIICVITVGKGLKSVPKRSIVKNIINLIMPKGKKTIEERVSCDIELPNWLREGLRCMTFAPSALNRQKPHCIYRNGVLTICVEDKGSFDMVDLGIAKKHFELGAEGKFKEGNNAKFSKFE